MVTFYDHLRAGHDLLLGVAFHNYQKFCLGWPDLSHAVAFRDLWCGVTIRDIWCGVALRDRLYWVAFRNLLRRVIFRILRMAEFCVWPRWPRFASSHALHKAISCATGPRILNGYVERMATCSVQRFARFA